MNWLLHATRLTQPELRILYDVYGKRPGASGRSTTWRGMPARARCGPATRAVGSAPTRRLRRGHRRGGAVRAARRGRSTATRGACSVRSASTFAGTGAGPTKGSGSRARDSGTTRTRGFSAGRRWTACSSSIEKGHLPQPRRRSSRENRDLIRAEMRDARLESASCGSYVAALGGDDVDASLLLLPWYGFVEASSARMRSTYARDPGEARRGRRSALPLSRGGFAPARARSASAASGARSTSRWAAGRQAKPDKPSSGCAATPTTSACSPRRSIPPPAMRSGTFPRRSPTSGLINAAISLSRGSGRRARRPRDATGHARDRGGDAAMNWGSWLLWGFVGDRGADHADGRLPGLRLTRMNLPYMLGTMFTPDRDRAKADRASGCTCSTAGSSRSSTRRPSSPGGRATWWLGAVDRPRPRLVRAHGRHAARARNPSAHGQRDAGARRWCGSSSHQDFSR